MARIFITGSSDGLGKLAAESLIRQGHRVVLHARNEKRAKDVKTSLPDAEEILTGDLASLEETKKLAEQVNALGRFDTVIHNAAINRGSGKDILHVNLLAPYILTCLIKKPQRLIYLSSGMHMQGNTQMEKILTDKGVNYSDSKLYIVMLAKGTARKWPGVFSNAVNPGWVPTRMGGPGAPDDLRKGYETQVWLAVSDEKEAMVSGRYFYHKREVNHHPEADNNALQEDLLSACRQITGVHFPAD